MYPVVNISIMASSEMFIRYSLMTIVLAIGYDSSSSWIDNCCVVTPAWLLIWSLTHFKFWYLFYHTIGRDLRAANFMIRLLLLVKKAEWRNLTVPKMFAATASSLPNKVMFYFKVSLFITYFRILQCNTIFDCLLRMKHGLSVKLKSIPIEWPITSYHFVFKRVIVSPFSWKIDPSMWPPGSAWPRSESFLH